MRGQKTNNKLSLLASIALGIGVMIGAGIFVLTGQIAELVGKLFPLVFLAGALVVGFSAYSYIKFSGAFPSSGGVASYLIKAYGPGTLAGTFSLLMYVSMVVAESLVAGTFASYTLRFFADKYIFLAPYLAVGLLILAFIINLSGNKIIGATATLTALVKVAGIALLAVVALSFSGLPNLFASPSINVGVGTGGIAAWASFLGALALAILAYKGFTTITNQGAEILKPHKNVGRAIIIAVLISAAVYVVIALAVAAGLDLPGIIAAKDYALAEAARPILGVFGMRLTIILAMVATISGVLAGVFAASRLLAMLSLRKQIPDLGKANKRNMALIVTISIAIILTIFFDLTRIASIGAIFYLIMDIAIHWGLVRYFRKKIDFKPLVPIIAIILDALVLGAFIYIKIVSDPFILWIALIGIVLIVIAERLYMLTHTDEHGRMHMGIGD